ncbi:MAG: hypothetical protein HY080_07245 [Gammaproteobacteria bacterium]|nr:hypothetical protein [Gammaproteobacteria bacterium]
MATLEVTPKEGKKTEQELRAQREKIYCTDTQGGAPFTPGAIAQALGITHAGDIPPVESRITMFHRLVEQNFVQEMDVFSEHYPSSWQTHVLSQFKDYHSFLPRPLYPLLPTPMRTSGKLILICRCRVRHSTKRFIISSK